MLLGKMTPGTGLAAIYFKDSAFIERLSRISQRLKYGFVFECGVPVRGYDAEKQRRLATTMQEILSDMEQFTQPFKASELNNLIERLKVACHEVEAGFIEKGVTPNEAYDSESVNFVAETFTQIITDMERFRDRYVTSLRGITEFTLVERKSDT